MGRIGALVPEVLRTEAQFRLLFAGQVLSLFGDRVMLVALPFAVLEAGGSIEAVGLVVTAQLVPFLVFALAGGVISDRGDRRRVLIASDVARLIVQGVGGVLLVADAASPLTLGVLAALYGTADAFFQPAFTGLLPQTVSHAGQLQPANALRGLSFSISSIAGPAIAGVLIGASGAGAAMLFDAGSFAVSVACLLRLRPAVAVEGIEEAPPAFLAAVMAGWREVRSRSWVLAGLGAMCAYSGIVLPAVYVLGPVSIAERLGGPGAWAAVVVAFGLGCVLGDLLLLRIRPPHALLTGGIALILASSQAAVYGAGADLPLTCALQFVAGIGVTAFFTLWEVSLQEHIPGEALSRVSSFDYLAATILHAHRHGGRRPARGVAGHPGDAARDERGRHRVRAVLSRGAVGAPPAARRGGRRRSVAFAAVAATDNGERRRRPAILAVDDEPAVLAAVARDLRRQFGEGYRILRAGSGKEGLEILRDLVVRGDQVALLVADQRMPRHGGHRVPGAGAPDRARAPSACCSPPTRTPRRRSRPSTRSRSTTTCSSPGTRPRSTSTPWSRTC